MVRPFGAGRIAAAALAYRAGIALVALAALAGSPAYAQSATLSYMVIPDPLPVNGATYALPGYGNVRVSWIATPSNGTLPLFTQQNVAQVQNQSAGSYNWGTDAQDINMNTTSIGPANYRMTFSFLSGPPDLSRLLMAFSDLKMGTTATVSQPWSLVGEFQIPLTPPTSPTLLSGSVVSSGYVSPATNFSNTGWALYKINSTSALSVLTVDFKQVDGDGLGLTLAYANPAQLKVCKVAGPGINLNDPPFGFNANGIAVSVPAGPGPGGYCKVGPSFPPGTNVTVTETIPAGVGVSSISVAPPTQLVNANLATGTAVVTMGAGVTEVTYTDERKTGYLEICKSTPAGAATGNFTFTVNPGGLGPFSVPAGACSPAIEVPVGAVTITETTQGAAMVGCSTIPANRQGVCNTAARTSTVTVIPGAISTQTIATIQNR